MQAAIPDQQLGLADARADPLGEDAPLLGGGVGKEHDELVAAVPGAEVRLAQLLPDDRRDVGDGAVPGGVAQLVVDRLELVQIGHDAGEGGPVPASPLHLVVQACAEGAQVGEAGEGVGLGQLAEGDLAAHQAEGALHPGPQLALGERLLEVVDRALVEGANLSCVVAPGGHQDDRDVDGGWVGAELGQHLEAHPGGAC